MGPYDTPGLAPRFQSEIDNYDLASSMQNQALDPRALALRRQAGPKSGFYRNQDQDMAAQDMRNKATVFRNRTMQGASDRDLQWRAQQDDRNWQHGALDRQMAAQEDQTKYLRQRDTKNDENADKQARLNYAMAKINSPDELVRAEGQDEYERLIGGGSTAASSAPVSAASAVSRPASTASDGYYENTGTPATPATSAAAPVNPRMAIALKEREARLAHQAELDRQQSARANYELQNQRFSDSEGRHDKQVGNKLKMLQMRLDRTKNPSDVTAIMNQMAGDSASLAPMVNQPTGMMGIGDAVGGALKSAYGVADQQGQAAARNSFKTDPLEQATYEAQQKRGMQGIDQQGAFNDIEDARKVLNGDPAFSNTVGSLRRELSSHSSPSWGAKVIGVLSKIPLFGAFDQSETLDRLGDSKISDFAAKVGQSAQALSAKYPGMKPDAIRQLILAELGQTLQSDSFNNTRRQQFSDQLFAPSAAPTQQAPAGGSKYARFMRIGQESSPGGMP